MTQLTDIAPLGPAPMSPASAALANGWSGSGLPLSQCEKLKTDNIHAVHEHMSAMLCPHRLHLEGVPSIAFRHNQAMLRAVTFNATDYGNPDGRVVVAIPPMDEIYLVQISLAGKAEIKQGHEHFVLRQGEMCVLGPNDPVRQVLEQGYKHFTVKLPKVEMENLLAEEIGFRLGNLRFSARPVHLEGRAAAFVHLVRTICDDIDADLPAYKHPRASRFLEESLECLLLASVQHNHSELFDGSVRLPAPFFVRRVEEYIHAHATETISLSDLVSVASVSTRSLHAGFRRFREATPMGYLKAHRLSLANTALRQGASAGKSVTDIAYACGFTHLSKFARDYYQRYGERPSATLRRL